MCQPGQVHLSTVTVTEKGRLPAEKGDLRFERNRPRRGGYPPGDELEGRQFIINPVFAYRGGDESGGVEFTKQEGKWRNSNGEWRMANGEWKRSFHSSFGIRNSSFSWSGLLCNCG